MPQEYLEGRTTDPATWVTSPQNLARIAAITYAAEARGRTVEERADQTRQAGQAQQAPAADPGSPQQRPPRRSRTRAGEREDQAAEGDRSPPGGTDGEVVGPAAGTRPAPTSGRRRGRARVRGSDPPKHGGPHGRPDPAVPHAGATEAPSAACRRVPAARGAVCVSGAAAGPAPLAAVPRWPIEPVVVRAPAPTAPAVSAGHPGIRCAHRRCRALAVHRAANIGCARPAAPRAPARASTMSCTPPRPASAHRDVRESARHSLVRMR